MAKLEPAANLNRASTTSKLTSILQQMWKEPWLLGLIILIFVSLFLFAVYPIYQVFKITLVSDKGWTLRP